MALEIERKFLVIGDGYKKGATKSLYCQGYLSSNPDRVVRVRIVDDSALLTIKGPSNGAVRSEFEYSIPFNDAKSLLELCEKPVIEKYRYKVTFGGMLWEIDEFLGDNLGLVVAEIELANEADYFEKPSWLSKEVTTDPRYYNSNLIHHPYKTWNNT